MDLSGSVEGVGDDEIFQVLGDLYKEGIVKYGKVTKSANYGGDYAFYL